MELAELIQIVSWALWIGVGLVVGGVAAGYIGGRKMLASDLFVGMTGAIVGGWIYAECVGNITKGQLIVSVLCATFVSIIAVYVLNIAWRRKG